VKTLNDKTDALELPASEADFREGVVPQHETAGSDDWSKERSRSMASRSRCPMQIIAKTTFRHLPFINSHRLAF